MGKYFSNDSNLTNYNLTDDNSVDVNNVIPSTDNLTQPLSDKTKEKLSQTNSEPNNSDEYINLVKNQTEQVSNMIQTYSEEAKKEFKNNFDKFAPAELFEKLNQLIFVVADLGNRITKLEQSITQSNDKSDNNSKIEIKDPAELYKIQNQLDNIETTQNTPDTIPNDDMTNINTVKEKLNSVKNGNPIPDEGFTDNSVNLEEMFPNLDDEAYQAAYTSINENNKGESLEKNKPNPGNMRNLAGF